MVFFRLQAGPKLITVSGWQLAEALPIAQPLACAACRKILDYGAGHFQEVAHGEAGPIMETVDPLRRPTHTLRRQDRPQPQEPVGIICLFFF